MNTGIVVEKAYDNLENRLNNDYKSTVSKETNYKQVIDAFAAFLEDIKG